MRFPAAHVPVAIAGLVLAACLPVTGGVQPRELSFDERVRAQEAIERVYRTHRTGVSRPFEAVAPRAVLEAKVRNYIAQSLALEHHWRRPVTAEMLEREVERMVSRSRMPDRLAELFGALGNDPILIQECLARQTLVARRVAGYYANDERIHVESRRKAERLRRDLEHGIGATVQARATGAVAVREERHGFVIEVPSNDDGDEAGRTRFDVPKQDLDTWLLEFAAGRAVENAASVASADLAAALEKLSSTTTGDPTGCSTGVWRPLAPTTPAALNDPLAVWTGAEMIVLGGRGDYVSHGARYDPATDTWGTTSSTDGLAGRRGATAIWTGTELIVWGGYFWDTPRAADPWPDGGRAYDPVTDSWRSLASIGAPEPRAGHSAIWTGDKLIVWGGFGESELLATGGIFDPLADSWSPTSATGAPEARAGHTAVWSGTEMIVWGGSDGTYPDLDTGGRYDPATDTWSPTSTSSAPSGRSLHAAVWGGDRMIVWGGGYSHAPLATGGLYDPVADVWSPTQGFGAPEARVEHEAVWTGSVMVVWGGTGWDDEAVPLVSGSRYDPAANRWYPASEVNAPEARSGGSAVWTGTEMLVWGGGSSEGAPLNSGGRYDPITNTWTAMSATSNGAPASQADDDTREAVWTGAELLVWTGAGDNGRYDPATDSWTPISTVNQPSLRRNQISVWTGTEMIVWGGYERSYVLTGGRYDPVTDSWTDTSTVNAPQLEGLPAVVWTGTEMIVWGSNTWEDHGTGGRYDPATDSWSDTSTTGAPPGARGRAAVWTGSEMLVWGGRRGSLFLDVGGRYSPATDSWSPVATAGAPAGRQWHSAVWTGSEMLVWGGSRDFDPGSATEAKNSGGRYDPATDAWSMLSSVDAPAAREFHSAVWSGQEMIVWGGWDWEWNPVSGGFGTGPEFATGGHYDPQSDTWWPTYMTDAPSPRAAHAAFRAGEAMLVWGGRGAHIHLATGGLYVASVDLDGDGYCSPADCDESDPNTYDHAPEINDGIDNQCPGDPGHGAVDEISGAQTLGGDGRLSWLPQEGATLYQVARSSARDFSADCAATTTANASYDTSLDPDPAPVWFYLVRSLAPNQGSWGLRSDDTERSVACE